MEIDPLTEFMTDMGEQENWPVLDERLDWAVAVSIEYDLTLAEAAVLRHVCTRCESPYGVRFGLDYVPRELRMWNEEFIEVYELLIGVGLIEELRLYGSEKERPRIIQILARPTFSDGQLGQPVEFPTKSFSQDKFSYCDTCESVAGARSPKRHMGCGGTLIPAEYSDWRAGHSARRVIVSNVASDREKGWTPFEARWPPRIRPAVEQPGQ